MKPIATDAVILKIVADRILFDRLSTLANTHRTRLIVSPEIMKVRPMIDGRVTLVFIRVLREYHSFY